MSTMKLRIGGLVLAVALLPALCGCRAKLDVTMDEFVEKVEATKSKRLGRKAFFEAVGGEPHKEVKIERYYWYFYCSDGKVIVPVEAAQLDDHDVVEIDAGVRKLD